METLDERRQAFFWAKVDRSAGDDACWTWRAYIAPNGYGQFTLSLGGRKKATFLAHRLAYELVRGPIEAGLVLDHLCRNPACANPGHLEPVTQRENVLRGVGVPAENARKTHCSRGHELAGSNLATVTNGSRQCRKCSYLRMKAYRQRKKEKGNA
jgi:hypothetical protein